MANSEISRLVAMANDIAANLSFHADADVRIADHIKRFWAPRMRKLLLEHGAGNAGDMSKALLSALKLL